VQKKKVNKSHSEKQNGNRGCRFVFCPILLGESVAMYMLFQRAVAALLYIWQAIALTASSADQQSIAWNDGAEQRIIPSI